MKRILLRLFRAPGTPRMSRLSFYSSPASRMGTAFSFVHANPPDCNFYISGALLHKQFLTSCPAVCISNISTSLDKIMILKFIISYFHLASLTNCIYNSCTYQKIMICYCQCPFQSEVLYWQDLPEFIF